MLRTILITAVRIQYNIIEFDSDFLTIIFIFLFF